MAPKYDIRWCPDEGVTDVNYTDVNVVDDASFDAWASAILAGFEQAKQAAGGKYPLMVNIDGLTISSALAARYSRELAEPVARDFATVIVRYGHHAMTGRVVAVEAMRRALHSTDPRARAREYAANIFASRDEALSFIRMIENGALLPDRG